MNNLGLCASCLKASVSEMSRAMIAEKRKAIEESTPEAVVMVNGTGYCVNDYAYFIGGVIK